MSSSATAAAISASPTTVVAIAPAPSASRSPARSGSKIAKPSCSTGSSISTSSLPCPSRSRPSPTRTRPHSTICSSTPAPRPCAPSPPIPNTWAPRSASSPSCTPGDSSCCIIPMCTAWCRAGASPPMANAGSPAVPASSCRCGCCPGSSAGCSSNSCTARSVPVNCTSHGQLEPLRDAHAFAAYLAPAAQAEWVVYAKPPFGGAQHVLDYLARYTHRVAISNNRLLSFSDGRVTFLWKDYQHGAAKKTMTLDADEFIRRFLLHVPPAGFQHIRHYGFLANRYRETKLAHCRATAATASAERRAIGAAGGLSRPVPEAHRPILTRLPTLRQGTHAGDRHLPRRLARTRTPAGHFVMLRRLSPRRLPSSAAFPTDPAVLRAFAPLNKTACISASQCALNRKPNRDTQPVHRRDIGCASPTHLAPIPIHLLAPIQFP